MKKGVSSIDAFLAITVMLVISLWLQNFFNLNLESSNDFGVQAGLNMKAVRAGSIMNSFFAIDPSPRDYLILNDTIKVLGNNLDVLLYKSGANVNASTVYNGVKYVSNYSVASQIKYDSVSQKVTR
jgi:hypothetical protein